MPVAGLDEDELGWASMVACRTMRGYYGRFPGAETRDAEGRIVPGNLAAYHILNRPFAWALCHDYGILADLAAEVEPAVGDVFGDEFGGHLLFGEEHLTRLGHAVSCFLSDAIAQRLVDIGCSLAVAEPIRPIAAYRYSRWQEPPESPDADGVEAIGLYAPGERDRLEADAYCGGSP